MLTKPIESAGGFLLIYSIARSFRGHEWTYARVVLQTENVVIMGSFSMMAPADDRGEVCWHFDLIKFVGVISTQLPRA